MPPFLTKTMNFRMTIDFANFVFLIHLLFAEILTTLSSSADCPQDCRDVLSFSLIGMHTKDKYKCTTWNQRTYANKIENVKILNTTFCVRNNQGTFWCSAKNKWDWDYCEYPPCKYYSTGCVQHWSATNYSVTVPLTHVIPSRNYIIVVYDESYECLLHKYCVNSCNLVDIYISHFFSQCKAEHCSQTASGIVFHSLKQNTIYRIYVIPTTEPTRVPDLTFIMAKTRIARPSTPFDIKTNSRYATALEIIWKKPESNGAFGDVSDYLVTIYGAFKEFKLSAYENIIIDKLSPCQTVCVSVEARNAAGKSDSSMKKCFTTKAVPAEVRFHPIQIRHTNKVSISWQYEKGLCKAEFIAKYKEQDGLEWSTQIISKPTVNLFNLVRNKMYTVSVRARVKDNDTGSSVDGKESTAKFFTRKDKIDLENVRIAKHGSKIFLSWTIHPDDFDAVVSIIVSFEDMNEKCSLIVFIQKMEPSHVTTNKNALWWLQGKPSSDCFESRDEYFYKAGNQFYELSTLYSNHSLKKYQIFAQIGNETHKVTSANVLNKDEERQSTLPIMDIFWFIWILPFICLALVLLALGNARCRKTSTNELHENYYSGKHVNNEIEENHIIQVRDFPTFYRNMQEKKAIIMDEFKQLTTKSTCTNMLNKKYQDLSMDDMNDRTVLRMKEFIAAIDPTKGTQGTFWNEIWKKGVCVIIMLSCGDCFQYWLGTGVDENKLKVALIKEKSLDGIIQRKIVLFNNESGEHRLIHQFQLLTWIDDKYPPRNDVYQLLRQFHGCIKRGRGPPYFVHSRPDSGRTGLFLCLHSLIQNLEDNDTNIDIFRTVLKINGFSNCKIVDCAHYLFLHEFVHDFLINAEQFPSEETDYSYIYEL